jgi:hypothetical protein
MLLTVSLILAAGSHAAADVTLVRDGQPLCAIRLPANPTSGETLAGQELQTYLRKMSGAQVPIGAQPAEVTVSILNASRVDTATPPPPRNHSFRIIVRPGEMLLLGRDDEGTEYAVYEVLERLGCRWFMPGEIGEVVPTRATVSLPETDVSQSPDFESRQIWYAWGAQSPEEGQRFADWLRRNKAGVLPVSHGHNFSGTIPPETYFATHPEYYSLLKGTRVPKQLCTSNPDVVRIAIEVATKYFDHNPNAIAYSLCPDDNSDFCECEKCRALDSGKPDRYLKGKPDVTDRLMVFWNAVAEGVRQKHPDKYLTMYAYSNHTSPPSREKVHPGVLPVITTMNFCCLHSIDNVNCASRQDLRRLIRDWGKAAGKVYLYEYDPVVGWREVPCPLYGARAREMPIYKQLGVRGFSFEGHKSWASNMPNYYVAAKMMWDSSLKLEHLMKDFTDKFFGAAGPPMLRYYTIREQALANTPIHPPGATCAVIPDIFTPEVLRDAEAALAEAERLADTDMARERLRVIRMTFDYLKSFAAYWRYLYQMRDFDGAMRSRERCLRLVDRLHALNSDYILDFVARGFFGDDVTELEKIRLTSRTFLRENDVFTVPEMWRFQPDLENVGLQQGWQLPSYDDSHWALVSTASQWYKQPGIPRIDGYAWGRVRFFLPKSFAGRKLIAHVGALDEQGDIYLNGQLAFHRVNQGSLDWRTPFEFDATAFLRPGEENLLAVQGFAEKGLGGVWQPVAIYSPKQ